LSSVPSPPSTSTRSTSSTSARRSATLQSGGGRMSTAVAVSNTAGTGRGAGHPAGSAGGGAAVCQCDFATMPTRGAGGGRREPVGHLATIMEAQRDEKRYHHHDKHHHGGHGG